MVRSAPPSRLYMSVLVLYRSLQSDLPAMKTCVACMCHSYHRRCITIHWQCAFLDSAYNGFAVCTPPLCAQPAICRELLGSGALPGCWLRSCSCGHSCVHAGVLPCLCMLSKRRGLCDLACFRGEIGKTLSKRWREFGEYVHQERMQGERFARHASVMLTDADVRPGCSRSARPRLKIPSRCMTLPHRCLYV